MSAEIIDMVREFCPAARLIGKRYEGAPNWVEWWENGWFNALEKLPMLPFNGDAYIGAQQGETTHWIGMLFPANPTVPAGFDFIDLPSTQYAVCFLRDAEGSADLYSAQTRKQCLERISAMSRPIADGWRLERYNCPRFTAPDDQGRVILDWAVEISEHG